MSTQHWPDHIVGTWPADDLRRAFVMGAKWWEWQKEGATMFPSDRDVAEEQAEKVFPGGQLPERDPEQPVAFTPFSAAELDALQKQRDKAIRELWLIFRRMSDLLEPDDFPAADLEIWALCTQHSAVQDRLEVFHTMQMEAA